MPNDGITNDELNPKSEARSPNGNARKAVKGEDFDFRTWSLRFLSEFVIRPFVIFYCFAL